MTIEPGGDPTKRWGMVVDIQKCVGCNTCTVACKHANVTPPAVQWRSVRDFEIGEYPSVERIFMPVGCMHCSEPPCMEVCPTTATRQREDGLVFQRYDLCIGCMYCHVACPYQARFLVADEVGYFEGRQSRVEEAHYQDQRLGVSTKCTFCVERVDEAKGTDLVPGIDGEVTPACVLSCIGQALHFGDFNDPDSNVSAMERDKASTRMHEELGTKPNLVYVWHQPKNADGTPVAEPENRPAMKPIPAIRQNNWDLRAVGNFALGGTSSGLLTLLGLIVVSGGAAMLPNLKVTFAGIPLVFDLYHLAALMMGLGLLSVFNEINRPARFLRVFVGYRTSWMSREAIVAVAFMGVALLKLFAATPVLRLLTTAGELALIASLLGAAFLYCQARILQAGKGVPAWRVPVMTWMLVFSGLLEGLGVLAVAMWAGGFMFPPEFVLAVPALGVALAAVNWVLWQRYMKHCAESVPVETSQELSKHAPVIQMAGRVLPLALFAVIFFLPVGSAPALLALTGLVAVVGGWYWKAVVVWRACHFQNFHLKSVPLRGSGAMAAPSHLTH